jgi:hypothetical protein
MDKDSIVAEMIHDIIEMSGIPVNGRILRPAMEKAFETCKGRLEESWAPRPGVTNPLDDEAMWGDRNV